jgi:hypothetical protein
LTGTTKAGNETCLEKAGLARYRAFLSLRLEAISSNPQSVHSRRLPPAYGFEKKSFESQHQGNGMPSSIEVDLRFRRLQKEIIHAYEEELKRDKERRARWVQPRQKRNEPVREILRAAQIDVERLDRFLKEDEATLEDFLREQRPPFVERSPGHQAEDAKKLARLTGLPISNRTAATVYAATLLASDQANLEGNSGQRGNPWILPFNPGQVKIKARNWGQGWGCYDFGPTYGPSRVSATFWFVFTPDRTAMWNLLALINLHGFYILTAHDDWWDCKHAMAHVEATMDVFQYFWHGTKRFGLLDFGADNINEARLFDEAGNFDYQAGLRAGDLAFVNVTISMNVYAQGGGSYSEVNFSDGTANFIEPLILFAWTS